MPVQLGHDRFGPYRLAGAWRVRSDDPRFGGVSGLAVDGPALLALTDSGAVIRFARPGAGRGPASIRELPGGPGDPAYKSRRDSEALVSDPAGRGWWVAFENRNELWLYDPGFTRPLGRVRLGVGRWPRNRGIEALATADGALLLFPERGDAVITAGRGPAGSMAIENSGPRISDAARLPSGQLIVLNRSLTPRGFSSSLTRLERTSGDFRYGKRVRLDLAPLDNAEAIAAERLPDGRTRLWLMTDDNFSRPLRTLLIALDMPPAPERG